MLSEQVKTLFMCIYLGNHLNNYK